MSDLKMSDVFNLPLNKNGFYVESESYRPLLSPVDLVDTIECCTAQEASDVCIAINSHDQLTADLAEANAEIERLKASIADLFNDEYSYINDWIICGIATNSKRGTEGRDKRMARYYDFTAKVAKSKQLLNK